MRKVTGPAASVEAVGHVATRIRRFAESIQQAHQFGIGPGEATEPWTTAFQREAVGVYASVLPPDYLRRLASGFRDAAGRMVELSAPVDAALEWGRVEAYLLAAATAIDEQVPSVEDVAATGADELDDVTPPVMPFDRLAEMMHPDGAASLRDAGAAVELVCGGADPSPLTDQEAEWVRQLMAGARSIDVARASGYSERSLYRALSDLWHRLGVENRTEGIALISSHGWVVPADEDQVRS